MKNFVFIAIALFSSLTFAQKVEQPLVLAEVWSDVCLDALSPGERAAAEGHIVKYSLTLKESLTAATVRNWILGRSLVSVTKSANAEGSETCQYGFARTGIEPEPPLYKGYMEISKEMRGLQSRLLGKKIEILKWAKAQCMSLDEINGLTSKSNFLTDLKNKNYRLVSVVASHGPNQCLYIFTQNLISEFGRN